MEELNIFKYLLVIIAVGEFALQMVISELSHWIKGKTGLSQPYKLVGLCKLSFYRKVLGKSWIILSPLSLVLIIIFSFHRIVSKLVDCPWCISFWLALAVNHFYFEIDIITSILLAPLALVVVTILDKIHFR